MDSRLPGPSSRLRRAGLVLAVCAAALGVSGTRFANAAPARAPVVVRASARGLESIRYGGIEMIGSGALTVQSVALKDGSGMMSAGSVAPVKVSYDPALRELRQDYPWGEVACRYAVAEQRVRMTVTVSNTSADTLQQITIQLLEAQFPRAPKGWTPDFPYIASNTGDPPVVLADYGSGTMAVCNDDIGGKPLLVGFPGRRGLLLRPLVVSTTPGWYLSLYLDRAVTRPIAPYALDTYRLSLRFGPTGGSSLALAGDLLARFGKTFPATLHWADRRPIGALHLSMMEPDHRSATNPRGWFGDPQGIDVVSPAGRAQFRERLLRYADDSVRELKAVHAQGMIVWDIEGQELAQPTSYIGDPRLLKTLAPEMGAVADRFFRRFRDAGLRVGVCIRPQQLSANAPGGVPRQQELDSDDAVASLLVDKIRYASERWGCTLFYCDSNGDPNAPYSAAVFEQAARRVAALGLRVLIIPEHGNTRYFASTAPYAELRLGASGTPTLARQVYPGAFSVIYVPDGPVDENRRELERSVARGDILMLRGWYPDPVNRVVAEIYRAAGR